jgi:hypothetical protein
VIADLALFLASALKRPKPLRRKGSHGVANKNPLETV